MFVLKEFYGRTAIRHLAEDHHHNPIHNESNVSAVLRLKKLNNLIVLKLNNLLF